MNAVIINSTSLNKKDKYNNNTKNTNVGSRESLIKLIIT